MRRWLLAGALFLLTALLAGCGGGSSGSSSQSAADAYAAYLKTLEPVHQRSQQVGDKLTASLQALDAGDMSTLDAAADSADAAAEEWQSERKIIESATPPPGLEDAHAKLLKGLDGQLKAIQQISTDLRAHDIAAIQAWGTTVEPTLDASKKDVEAWKAAVKRFGSDHDATVPSWINDVAT